MWHNRPKGLVAPDNNDNGGDNKDLLVYKSRCLHPLLNEFIESEIEIQRKSSTGLHLADDNVA